MSLQDQQEYDHLKLKSSLTETFRLTETHKPILKSMESTILDNSRPVRPHVESKNASKHLFSSCCFCLPAFFGGGICLFIT